MNKYYLKSVDSKKYYTEVEYFYLNYLLKRYGDKKNINKCLINFYSDFFTPKYANLIKLWSDYEIELAEQKSNILEISKLETFTNENEVEFNNIVIVVFEDYIEYNKEYQPRISFYQENADNSINFIGHATYEPNGFCYGYIKNNNKEYYIKHSAEDNQSKITFLPFNNVVINKTMVINNNVLNNNINKLIKSNDLEVKKTKIKERNMKK